MAGLAHAGDDDAASTTADRLDRRVKLCGKTAGAGGRDRRLERGNAGPFKAEGA